jgi:hypothetical protein
MVWRDLDFTVVCDSLDVDAVAAVGSRLAMHPRIRQVVFRNDTGAWNADPGYPDGLYLGLSSRSPAGHDWRSDIWFVDEPDRQPDLKHLQSLPPQLTDEIRAAILRVKGAWSCSPEYGKSLRSFDIYTAVIDAGVRGPEDFADWLMRRGRGVGSDDPDQGRARFR